MGFGTLGAQDAFPWHHCDRWPRRPEWRFRGCQSQTDLCSGLVLWPIPRVASPHGGAFAAGAFAAAAILYLGSHSPSADQTHARMLASRHLVLPGVVVRGVGHLNKQGCRNASRCVLCLMGAAPASGNRCWAAKLEAVKIPQPSLHACTNQNMPSENTEIDA